MRCRDLITDPGTKQLSHTKLWAHVAYGTSTWVVVYQTLKGAVTAELVLIYLAIVAGSTLGSKLLSLRYGGAAGPAALSEPTEKR